jgi:DNA mismatch repair protein MutL
VRLQQLHRALEQGTLASHQPSLFAATVELPALELGRITAAAPALATLGLVVEPFGGGTLAIKGVPPILEGVDLRRLLIELAPMLGDTFDRADALKVLASHAAAQQARSFSHEEAHALLAELDEADFAVSCEHSTVVVWELPLLELERRSEN